MKKGKSGVKIFEIYWEQVGEALKGNSHYKKLKKQYVMADGTMTICELVDRYLKTKTGVR